MNTQMTRRKKPGKTLERIAREIKDSDDFVTHVGNISERYRAEHALDAGPRKAAVRQALKTFHKHAQALATWLRQAQRTNAANSEREALEKISTALDDTRSMHAQSEAIADWLSRTSVAAERGIGVAKQAPKKSLRAAPRVAAEGLRATFEFHKLKLSTQASDKKPSDAVRLLCAIAKNAGDALLTAQEAGQALLESSGSSRRTAQTTRSR